MATDAKHVPRLPVRFDPKTGTLQDADGHILCQFWSKSEEDYPDARANGEAIELALNTRADLLALIERVAEHFEDTDAPLGVDARRVLAAAKGESG